MVSKRTRTGWLMAPLSSLSLSLIGWLKTWGLFAAAGMAHVTKGE
jgi:hypothetical protein